ncbi:MAG: hypothetical protein WCN21_12095 [Comamonadaceae bacterium]
MKFPTTSALTSTQRIVLAASSLLLLSCIALTVKAEGAAPAVPGASAKAVRTYVPKAGESLDQVIRKTMADSPLRIELLRKAIVDLNPSAFVAGNPARMRAHVSLQLPDSAQLAQSVLTQHMAASKGVAVADENNGRSGSTSGVPDERRRWVRFP